jgi:CRISP-associated protein Cas1
MQIVLDSWGLQLSVRNQCFLIEAGKDARMIHPSKVSSILVTMPSRLSSPALVLAAQCEIPVIICDHTGSPQVRIWSPHFINISTLRRKQYSYTRSEAALEWASDIIASKIEGQLNNLAYIADRRPSQLPEIQKAIAEINHQRALYDKRKNKAQKAVKREILFIEAYTASRYWALIGQKLPEPFIFTLRVKPHAKDVFNSCLNYFYGMLKNHVETAVLSMGLDPALGIIHRDGYKLPSLVFDLMEPFRPHTDRMLLTAIIENDIDGKIAETKGEEILLTRPGRKKLITLFNDKMESRVMYGGTVTALKNHILIEAKHLSDQIKQYAE